MDNEQIKLIAHLRVLLVKETGQKVDLVKFVNDADYARQVLASATATANQALLATALRLTQLRGIVPGAAPERVTSDPETSHSIEDTADKKRYVGNLR
jgi:hypothetical protein